EIVQRGGLRDGRFRGHRREAGKLRPAACRCRAPARRLCGRVARQAERGENASAEPVRTLGEEAAALERVATRVEGLVDGLARFTLVGHAEAPSARDVSGYR